jgi:hypothetical protein
MKRKNIYILSTLLFLLHQNTYACAVCLGDITKEEIIAYSVSVIFMISLLVIGISFIYRKLKKHYDVE